MAEETKIEITEGAQKTRRAFVRTAAQVAVTAPAVGLLLSAPTKAQAAIGIGSATAHHILDDYTFGNNEEDVDAFTCGGFPKATPDNLNCATGAPAVDDHVEPPA